MSRIGKQPIDLKGTKVDYKDRILKIQGPKGALTREISPVVELEINDKEIVVTPSSEVDPKKKKAFHGLYRALIQNMVQGVTEGYEKRLEINGVGFKAQVSGKVLVLNLGFSHPINHEIPEGLEIKVENKNTLIIIKGIDKQLLGNTAAAIRRYYPPEPYKGKGVKYVDEVIRRKKGKRVA